MPTSTATKRKTIDCSKFPSEKNCTLVITGSEEELLPVAVYHAVTWHGHQDTPELRDEIRKVIQQQG